MGKVTIIVESDQISTDNLVSIARWMIPTEAAFELETYERYQNRPEVQVYIVSSDEED